MPPACTDLSRVPLGGGGGRPPDGGYVLIELMLALLIVSLLAGLALPRVSGAGGASEGRAAAARIAVLLRADRNAALRSGRPVVSRIDPAAGSVRSGAGSAAVLLPQSFALRPSESLAQGVRFDPEGRAVGGEIAVVGARGRGIVLRIDPVSAAVEIGEGGERHGW